MWRVPMPRTLINDVALTVLFVGLGVAIYAAGFAHIGNPDDALGPSWFPLLVLGVAGCFELCRSTHPAVALAGVTSLLVVDTVVAPSVPIWLMFSNVVYAVCVYGGARLVHLMFGICAFVAAGVLTLVAAFPETAGWQFLFICVLWLIAFVASPLAYGWAVREHRTALHLERAHSQTLSALAAREKLDAVVAERRRLARELHDVIAGRLSAIAMHSAAAQQYPDNAEINTTALAAIRTSSVDALTEMRGLIDLLAADEPDSGSEPGAAEREAAGLRRLDRLIAPIRMSGTAVDLTHPTHASMAALADELPAVVDIATHRILAEALTNAVTHAPGQPISLTIELDDDALSIEVCNLLDAHDASPSRENAHRGRGIENMTTRAGIVGGHLAASPVGERFVVAARLPTNPVPTSDAPEGDQAGRDESTGARDHREPTTRVPHP